MEATKPRLTGARVRVIAGLAVALSLTACGTKGPLTLPQQAGKPATSQATPQSLSTPLPSAADHNTQDNPQ